jgi:hypothetical protein
VYAWRAAQGSNSAEQDRMTQDADFAFRQAFALCPYSPEAVFRYVKLLQEHHRTEAALAVVQTARKMRPGDPQLNNLVQQLTKNKAR